MSVLLTDLELASVCLRVAGTTIAAYDYVLTLPYELQLYRAGRAQFNLGSILFVAIRYSSIIAIVFAAISSFAPSMSDKTCSVFFLFPLITKLIATFISHYIMLLRTYCLSGKSRLVLYTLWTLFVAAMICESFSFLFLRHPITGPINTCSSGFADEGINIGWVHWIMVVAFDTAITGVAASAIWDISGSVPLTKGLRKVLITDGLWYFVVLTFLNLVNMVFFLQSDASIQGAAVPLGEAFTMIMSERIIMNVKDAFGETAPPQPLPLNDLETGDDDDCNRSSSNSGGALTSLTRPSFLSRITSESQFSVPYRSSLTTTLFSGFFAAQYRSRAQSRLSTADVRGVIQPRSGENLKEFESRIERIDVPSLLPPSKRLTFSDLDKCEKELQRMGRSPLASPMPSARSGRRI